jgi:SWI/SNF-related matrix-associated actin-dependent regulator of chromatin subfamily A-like protein 1
MDLFPYQVEGAKFLATVKRGLLADEMGLGKSAQAIAACDELRAQRVLVICPASLTQNWRREFLRFQSISRYVAEPHRVTGGNGPLVNVTSYDRAARDPEGLAIVDWDVLILDEAHYLKNHKAKRTKAIFGEKCDGEGGLVSRAAHVFCLTGTPTPNNPSELWSMLRAVMPAAIERPMKNDKLKPMAYWPFVEKFCVTQDTGFGIKIIKGKNLPELKARIAPFILRRKKEEVLKDLPPIRFDTLALEGKFPREAAGELRMIAEALEKEGVAGLKAIGSHVAQLRRLTGMAKVSAAAEWVRDFLEGGDGKLVCFAHHKDVIGYLAEAFPEAVVVTGDAAPATRQAAVDSFQNNPKVRLFLGNIQAAGVGLTLTAASDALFVESSWTPSENQQAAMRIHRIGQRNACLVRFAMLAGSIDEDIQRAVMRKTTDIARLFG